MPAFASILLRLANWATDTSPFKIDAVKAYAELSLENFSDYVEKTHREETFAENPDWSTATKYFAFINGQKCFHINIGKSGQ